MGGNVNRFNDSSSNPFGVLTSPPGYTPGTKIPVNRPCFGLWYPVVGNQHGCRLRITIAGGNPIDIAPGTRLKFQATQMEIQVPAVTGLIGSGSFNLPAPAWRLITFDRPDSDIFASDEALTGLSDDIALCVPNQFPTSSASQWQTANAAAGTNAPIATSDGISLQGVNSLRVIVTGGNGLAAPVIPTTSPPAAGDTYIRWWLLQRSLSLTNWVQSEVITVPTIGDNLALGFRGWSSGDIAALLGPGSLGADRAYPEVIGWNVTSGLARLAVYVVRSGLLVPGVSNGINIPGGP